ncbi:MAG: MFS transporter [Gammaproteobacteria bacterium]|nr:MFS transporter [Gammaproteobacteria bacterium]
MLEIRFTLAYLFFFALLGVWIPYLAVHLSLSGFGAAVIGMVFSLFLGTRIVAPYVLQPILKAGGNVYWCLAGSLLAALLSSVLLLLSNELWSIVLATLVFSACWNAALPLLETYCLSMIGADGGIYSRIRIGGSVGFVLASMSGGLIFSPFTLTSFPLLATITLALCVISIIALPRQRESGSRKTLFLTQSQWRSTSLFFVSCFMLQISHGVYYALFTPLLSEQGFSELEISSLWSVAVLSEVGVFLMAARLFRRFPVAWVLAAGLLVSAVRWWITPVVASDLYWISTVQLLHGVSFGASHAAAMIWLSKSLPTQSAIAGQALYSALCFGLGGAIGSAVGGLLWEIEPHYSFVFAGIVSLIGYVIWSLQPKTEARV